MHDSGYRKERLVHPGVATALNGAAGIGSVCGLLLLQTPYRSPLALLAIIPPLAALIWFRTDATFDAFMQVCFAFVIPSVVLFLRAIFDFHLLRGLVSICAFAVFAVICGALTTVVMSKKYKPIPKPKFTMFNPAPDKNQAFIGTVLTFAIFYSYGAIAEANVSFDRSPPQTYQATVLQKEVSSARGLTYYLELTPWGPQQQATSTAVTANLYYSIKPGDNVCIELRAGALKVPWYMVTRCR